MKRSDKDERDDAFNTEWTDETSKESNRQQLNKTILSLRESINHLKEVNKELEAKNDKHKDFISIAAHELRSPIMPILGTLELIEYEFDEKIKQKLR